MTTEDFQFLREIRVNNNREWFQANRNRYDAARSRWTDGVDRVIAAMSAWSPDLSSQTAKTSVYRFNRDTRFSLDKSPYKTYFSALISYEGRKTLHAAYYLHLSPDGCEDPMATCGLYGGIWCPDSKALRKLRIAIIDNIEEFEDILSEPSLARLYPGWSGARLKTVPQGWPKDHPQIELLRLKDIGKHHPLNESFFLQTDWPEQAAQLFRPLKPLIDFLNYSLDE